MAKKYTREVDYDTAFEWLQDIMTPYEINAMTSRGAVFLDVIDRVKYNQPPKKRKRRKKRRGGSYKLRETSPSATKLSTLIAILIATAGKYNDNP